MGYIIGVEYALLENINADAPRFDFGKFGKYLSRGVQVFLANLLLSLACAIPLLLLVGACIVAGLIFLEHSRGVAIACFVCAGLGELCGGIVMSVALVPLSFKAGLEDRFASAFEWRFALDYLRRVGLLTLGYNLLLMLMMLPFMIVACVPILGILVLYAEAACMMFISAHIRVQFYLEYLQRGGIPINVKYEPPGPAFPVLTESPPPAPALQPPESP